MNLKEGVALGGEVPPWWGPVLCLKKGRLGGRRREAGAGFNGSVCPASPSQV